MSDNDSLIDIDKVFKERNPRLYKIIPRFGINYLKKIIHQEQLNTFIESNKNSGGIEFINAFLKDTELSCEVSGLENIPENSKIIFASNHPIGSIDGISLINEVHKIFGCTKIVVNDLLTNIKNLNAFFIGVNKHGITSKYYVEELNQTFESDIPIIFFPSGMASRKIKGEVRDLEWKKTFIARSIKFERDVVPVYIEGSLSNFFYNIAKIRKAVGIKSNLEMIFLADEMYKQKGKTLKIHFGKPISYKKFDKNLSHYDWAQKVKNHIYTLKKDKKSEFKGV